MTARLGVTSTRTRVDPAPRLPGGHLQAEQQLQHLRQRGGVAVLDLEHLDLRLGVGQLVELANQFGDQLHALRRGTDQQRVDVAGGSPRNVFHAGFVVHHHIGVVVGQFLQESL